MEDFTKTKLKDYFFNKSESLKKLCSYTEFRNFAIGFNLSDEEINNAYEKFFNFYSNSKFFITETNFKNNDCGENIKNISNSLRLIIEDSDFTWTDISEEEKIELINNCLREWGIFSKKEKDYITNYLLEKFKYIPSAKVGNEPLKNFYSRLAKECHRQGYLYSIAPHEIREVVNSMNIEWNDIFLKFNLLFYSYPIAHATLDKKFDELNSDPNKVQKFLTAFPHLSDYAHNGKLDCCYEVLKQIVESTNIFERLDFKEKENILKNHEYHKCQLPYSISGKSRKNTKEQDELARYNSSYKKKIDKFISFAEIVDVNKIMNNKISKMQWRNALKKMNVSKSNISKIVNSYDSCFDWYISCFDIILSMKEFVKNNMQYAKLKTERAERFGGETCRSFDIIRETIAKWDSLFVGKATLDILKKLSKKKMKSESTRALVEKLLNNIDENIIINILPYRHYKNKSLENYIEILNDSLFDDFEKEYPLWFSYRKSKILKYR